MTGALVLAAIAIAVLTVLVRHQDQRALGRLQEGRDRGFLDGRLERALADRLARTEDWQWPR